MLFFIFKCDVEGLGICLAKILVIFFLKKLNLFKFCSKILEILEKSHLSVGAEFFFLRVEKTLPATIKLVVHH